MAHEDQSHRPYHAPRYELGLSSTGQPRELTELAPDEADGIGRAFAGMDPWAAYGTPPERLTRFFTASEEAVSRCAIRINGRLAGLVVLRASWLHGPYLQFLGLLPDAQGQGVGAAVLDWIEREAPPGTRNLWLCVSAINPRARTFYERHGYELAAALPALAADHMDELLMRRRL